MIKVDKIIEDIARKYRIIYNDFDKINYYNKNKYKRKILKFMRHARSYRSLYKYNVSMRAGNPIKTEIKVLSLLDDILRSYKEILFRVIGIKPPVNNHNKNNKSLIVGKIGTGKHK